MCKNMEGIAPFEHNDLTDQELDVLGRALGIEFRTLAPDKEPHDWQLKLKCKPDSKELQHLYYSNQDAKKRIDRFIKVFKMDHKVFGL